MILNITKKQINIIEDKIFNLENKEDYVKNNKSHWTWVELGNEINKLKEIVKTKKIEL